MNSKLKVKTDRPRRYKRAILFLLTILCTTGVAVLVAIPPLIMGPMVNMHVHFDTVHTAEEFGLAAEKLWLETDDALHIIAYDVPVEAPKAVVIFVSGIHNPSVTAYFGHARMLHDHGYASVLYEMRAHGESEGDVIGLGYTEWLDTKAVVKYIKAKDTYKDVPIVVYGVSMGGATAINSIGQIEDIDALISLSAYSSWPDAFCDNMVGMGAPQAFGTIQKPFVSLYNVFKYGVQSLRMQPKNQIVRLGNRPALIMHSLEDSQVPFASFERIMKQAPGHVETWVREGDAHLIAHDFTSPTNDPAYADRILSFLERHFGNL